MAIPDKSVAILYVVQQRCLSEQNVWLAVSATAGLLVLFAV